MVPDSVDVGVVGRRTMVPPRINAVESVEVDSRTGGDTVETGTGTTVATTTRSATPIDTVIRVATAKAPTRPTHLPYPIVVSFPAAPPVDAWDIAHSQRSASSLPKHRHGQSR